MCVVACTPFRLKRASHKASSAASTTGAYSGRQPAITMLIASTSRVRLPQRGGTRLDEPSGVAAQRRHDCRDLLRRRRHERKAVGLALLVVPLDEIGAFRHLLEPRPWALAAVVWSMTRFPVKDLERPLCHRSLAIHAGPEAGTPIACGVIRAG